MWLPLNYPCSLLKIFLPGISFYCRIYTGCAVHSIVHETFREHFEFKSCKTLLNLWRKNQYIHIYIYFILFNPAYVPYQSELAVSYLLFEGLLIDLFYFVDENQEREMLV